MVPLIWGNPHVFFALMFLFPWARSGMFIPSHQPGKGNPKNPRLALTSDGSFQLFLGFGDYGFGFPKLGVPSNGLYRGYIGKT